MTEKLHEAASINAEQVEKYLSDNPEFFTRRPELLGEINLPHESGRAVSLVERQVSVLRERNVEMRNRLASLLDNARDNDRLFDQTKKLTLALIEAKDLTSLIDALYSSFKNDFKIHYTRLVLFSNQNLDSGSARVEDVFTARNYIGKRLQSRNTVSGGLDVKEIGFLFDDDAHNIGSGAMTVLTNGNLLGTLAIGNQDPTYYHSSMGTLFLSYIAEVLNRILPKHLPPSP